MAPTPEPRRPEAPAPIPAVLTPLDASRYGAIFALQEEGNWKAADVQVSALEDQTLMGAVLAQRYLSPAYTVSFAETRDWLALYADQPDARAIWVLAKRKASGKSVPQPVASSTENAGQFTAGTASAGPRLPPEPGQFNLHRPALFEAGLAAWRGQRWADAARDFEQVARASNTATWYVAAAAFWAARAHVMLKEPSAVDSWFEIAAQQPRTFYGLLARGTLGLIPDTSFGPPSLTAEEGAQLQALPAGRRALALVQVGESDRAEAELRALSASGNRGLAGAVVALADYANMPALCLSLGNQTNSESAHYPVPRWQPQNGFSVDRALLFALMMEESRFQTEVRNGSGAAGLMQLMPQTAKSVAHSAGIPLKNVSDLVDPVLNLSIGQEYVKQLIGYEQVNGNLILLLAAYNTGPGPLAKWQKQGLPDDPLMFIESLPNQEARLYVERVLTNLWIYRQRLGQDLPDLDALAANHWPAYVSMNASTHGAYQHAAAR